jgi:hypothetical protein
VLLLGPNGIWIFEVKYWNGIISKHDGVWTAGYQRGRNKIYDKSPDEQWLNQKQEISKTIKMQLSSRTWPADLIKGGIVFAHSKVVFGSITNPKASYGRPGAWHKRIRETKPLEGFNLSDRLEVLDALVLYANRHEKEEVKIVSASEMANELYNHAETALRKYVAERVK